MDTLHFLQRVLPTKGVYCRFSTTGKKNKFCADITTLVDELLHLDKNGQDAYFAISSFKDDKNRRNDNVCKTRALVMDVDCGEGKPYATWKDGLKAFGKFIVSVGMPRPLVVRSGYGLHIYWLLGQDTDRPTWVSMAHALLNATKEKKFYIDTSKITDPSLVLRPIGTHNYKDPTNPIPVVVLIDGGDTTVDAVQTALSRYYNKPDTRQKLVVPKDLPPAKSHLVVKKCQQVKWAVDNRKSVAEPLWYTLMGVAAFCENPDQTAAQWSEGHPGYSEDKTASKIAQWKAAVSGPATCAKFEAERPGGCKGCQFLGKVNSPVMLGVHYDTVGSNPKAPEAAIINVPLPKPFKRTSKGMVATIDGTDIEITPFDIYPVSYGHDEHLGYEVAQFVWDRPHVGWKLLAFRQAFLVDGLYREFVSAIADQGIVLQTRKQTEYLQIMLRAYMDELRKLRTITNMYSTMGWKEDNTVFVLGDALYRYNKAGAVEKDTVQLSSHVNRAGDDMYTVNGSSEIWKAGTGILAKAQLLPHQFSIGIGFASVLMQFTGLKGMTVSFHGATGSGKSLAQLIQQSIWGDPEKLHFQSKFTANALFSRFALYGNLPMTVDEATQMSDSDVGDYLYWVSQGRDKARLNKQAIENAPKEWALLSTLSTNKPISYKLTSTGKESSAQLARLLELKVDVAPIFNSSTDAGRKLHQLFTHNYGHAGREFVRRLMQLGERRIRDTISQAMSSFPDQYSHGFSGEERYWEVLLVLVDLSLRLAEEWGLIAFERSACIKWAVDQINTMRDTIRETQMDVFDLLAQYVNEHLKDTLLVWHDIGKEPRPHYDYLPPGPIRIRIDGERHYGTHKLVGGTMYLERSSFRPWFVERGGDWREFLAKIKMDMADKTPQSKKFSLGKNTPLSPPQCYVVGLNLSHARLRSMLEGIDDTHGAIGRQNLTKLYGKPKPLQ